MPEKSTARPFILALTVAILLTLLLAFDIAPFLRGGAGWRWPYVVPEQLTKLLPALLAITLYLIAGGLWLPRLSNSKHSPLPFLLFTIVGGLAVQLAFLAFYGNPFEQLFLRTVATLSGGYYEVAITITDLPAFLRDFPDLMPTWTAHPAAQPPGIVLSFYAGQRFFEAFPNLADTFAGWARPLQCHNRLLMMHSDASIAAALVGMLLPIAGVLSIFPAYDLTRRITNRHTALLAALWIPLIPSFILFTGQWNQLYMPLTMGALWLLHRALEDGKLIYYMLAGLLMSVATFFSFANVSLIGMLGLYGLLYLLLVGRIRWSKQEWQRTVIGIALLTTSLTLVWIIYYAVSGNTILAVFEAGWGAHFIDPRRYLPWVALMPLDYILFTGYVLFALVVVEVYADVKAITAARAQAHPQTLIPLAVVIGITVMAVAGITRGEVGRLLMGLMPLTVIGAALAVQRQTNPTRSMWLVGAALAFQLLIMGSLLPVVGHGLEAPPQRVNNTTAPTLANTIQANFGDKTELVGFAGSGDSTSGLLEIDLAWRALSRFDHHYFGAAFLVDEAGEIVDFYDWPQTYDAYPTACWQPGEVITEMVEMPVENLQPGTYWLSLSLFESETRARLLVTVPGLPPDEQVGIGPFVVE